MAKTYVDLTSGIMQGVHNTQFIEKEIGVISKEINKLLAQKTTEKTLTTTSSFFVRLNGVIATLQGLATKEYLKDPDFKKKSKNYKPDLVNDVKTAQRALKKSKIDLLTLDNNHTIKTALMEGYIIVNLLREAIIEKHIDYKVLTIGKGTEGKPVLFEAHPTMAEVLSASNYDNLLLKVNITQTHFQKLLSDQTLQGSKTNGLTSILSQMTQVQLNSAQTEMLENLLNTQEALLSVEGAGLNKGHIGESFIDYLLNSGMGHEKDLDYIYSLLEKGKNNLAYYKGPDVETADKLFQVKTLSVYGSSQKEGASGRFDVAKLSNVLTPLLQIQGILMEMAAKNEVIDPDKLAAQVFIGAEGEGDRPFQKDITEIVQNVIKKEFALQET